MTTFKIIVTNLGGLTSRSSAELVGEANKYHCNVTMKLDNGDECDLKSIMNVFALTPIDKGAVLTIVCEGEDEDKAILGFKKLCKEYSF